MSKFKGPGAFSGGRLSTHSKNQSSGGEKPPRKTPREDSPFKKFHRKEDPRVSLAADVERPRRSAGAANSDQPERPFARKFDRDARSSFSGRRPSPDSARPFEPGRKPFGFRKREDEGGSESRPRRTFGNGPATSSSERSFRKRPSGGGGRSREDGFRGESFRGDSPRRDFHGDSEFPRAQKSTWEFKSEAARSIKASDFDPRAGAKVSFETHAISKSDSAKNITFAELELPEQLLKNLTSLGFEKPTPIQGQAIPTALSNRDLIGVAQTGTGKTAAFLIPTLTKLMLDPKATALVLVPTRELAEQVFKNAISLSKDIRIPMALLIGGVAMHGQFRALSVGPRLIVATPGRLMDHLRTRKTLLANMKYLILDEADRMVDFGFAPQVLEILASAPAERQSLLFSATMPSSVQKFVQRLTKNPLLVQMPREAIHAPKIDEKSMQVDSHKKNEALLDCVNQTGSDGSVLVFAKTQIRTEKIHLYLEDYGISCEKIHGGRSQAQRKRSLERFRKGQARVLIATDVAARGIDVDHISLVVNFDMPQSAEDYIHRIGRTGRAGRTGSAVSFLTNDDRRMWQQIQRLMRIQSGAPPQAERTASRGFSRGRA